MPLKSIGKTKEKSHAKTNEAVVAMKAVLTEDEKKEPVESVYLFRYDD
jgi:hypothetical protein